MSEIGDREKGKQDARAAEARRSIHTHADGTTHIHADGITHTHADGTTHTHADGIPHTHADGITYTHADGTIHTHADGTAHEYGYEHDHTQGHPHTHSHEHTKAVLNRLSRAIGHLESIKRMVEDGRDCSEVLIQLAAVRSAISSTSRVIMEDHINHCIVDAVEHGDMESIEELNKAISYFIK